MSLALAEGIVVKLRSVSAVTSRLTQGASGIGHGLLPAGAKMPYILVQDVSSVPQYTFGNHEAISWDSCDIYVYSRETPSKSAQTVAQEILDVIYNSLQNQEFSLPGRKIEMLRRCSSRPSGWQTTVPQEINFRAGHQWEAMTYRE